MMIFRRIPFAVTAAILALAAIPAAQAGNRGGLPVGMGGVTTNSVVANNIAAGIGNVANQGVFAQQFGQSPHAVSPLQGPQWGGVPVAGGGGLNSTTATNLAAGAHNHANQMVGAMQGPGGFNRIDATNVAAGFGNLANQQIMATQR